MSGTVLIQERERGLVHRCPVWVPVNVGRDPEECRIVVGEPDVSRRHCELYAEFDGRLRVKDLSRRGTWLGAQRVTGQAHARPGDVLRLGDRLELAVLGTLDPVGPARDREGELVLPRELPPCYLLLRRIGRGAAGVVFEAYDEQRRKRCAIKVLSVGGRASPEVVQRFQREALLQSRLGDYPGIVSVRDFGTIPDAGELFFSMDYVPGVTLRDRLKQGLPVREGVRLLSRVARAVQHAHDHGVIHRDLKPANVLVSDKDTVRLTDFGVCKVLQDEEGLTATGVMLGTPNYMAPEQLADAKRVGPAADVYALGAMLYTQLAGRAPYLGRTLPELIDLLGGGVLEPVRNFAPDVDLELEALCEQAMAWDPATRPASALELARRLEDWLKRQDPPPRVSLRPPGT